MSACAVNLGPWRNLCADFATTAIYQRYASELERFGERGRQTCRQDMLYHLDYMQAALLGDAPDTFAQYVLWLKEVLNSRGVPAAHLGASFDFIATFFNNNLAADEAAVITTILDAGRAVMSQDALPAVYGEIRLPMLPEVEHYRASILHGQHKTAASLMMALMNKGSSLTQASVHLVQPALYQVGNLWQSNQVTVSQEHLATAITQNVLAAAYMQAQFAPPLGKTAIFACVEENHHSVGLHILADGFETAGWDVLNLGANLPTQDLIREMDAKRPDLLALSISLPIHITTARQTIDMLHAELGSACPAIWIGGLSAVTTRQIWRITGADGWAVDALQALEQL